MMYYLENIPSHLNEKFLKSAIDFGMVGLGLNDNTHVVFEWTELYSYDGLMLDTETDGEEHWYEVQLNKHRPNFETIKTIFHELTHIQQRQLGKLSQNGFNDMWNGDIIEHTDYKDRPWEIEAEESATKLFSLWEDTLCKTPNVNITTI